MYLASMYLLFFTNKTHTNDSALQTQMKVFISLATAEITLFLLSGPHKSH